MHFSSGIIHLIMTSIILKVNNRLSNVVWGNNDIAIATDIWWNNRNVKTYLFNPSNTSKKALIIENRNYQDIYSDPGNFLMKKVNTIPKY